MMINTIKLKDLREDNDLYQKDVANYLNISQQQYSRYETGIRSLPIELLDQLANFYNTSTDYIMGRTSEKKPYPLNPNTNSKY